MLNSKSPRKSPLIAILNFVSSAFHVLAAAGAVSHSVENRRTPREKDLEVLGMAGAKFNLK